MRSIVTILMLLAFSLHAQAREFTSGEKTGLEKELAAFSRLIDDGKFEETINLVPVEVFAVIAETAGVSVEKMRKNTIALVKKSMEKTKFESFRFNIEDTEFRELPDKTPYAIIPTETVMAIDGKRYHSINNTLAFTKDGNWRLIRLNGPSQLNILIKAFPIFENEKFEMGKTVKIDD